MAWESALVFHVGPRDFWESDMIHERQRKDMAGMGVGGALWALGGMSSQSPEAKRNLDITSVCSQHTTDRDGNRVFLSFHGLRMFRGKGNKGRRRMALENKTLLKNPRRK